MAGSSRHLRLGRLGLALLLPLAGSCADRSSPTGPNFAAGSGGAGKGPTVRETDPSFAPQGTTLSVRVLGSGYDPGTQAVWALNGDTAFAVTRVKTNSTSFVSGSELVASITIDAGAVIDLYDVMVVTAGGKRGIGIEKFEVTISNHGGPVTWEMDEGAGYGLRSDGAMYIDGGPGYFPNCVQSSFFAAGLVQLRTIANTEACKAVTRGGWRFYRFHLGAPVLDLDQDGVAEAVEDAPARLLAEDAFAQNTTSTLVRVLILQVNSDGTTEQDTRWELRYRTDATVSSGGGSTMIIEAAPGAATADVFQGLFKRGARPIATVNLPFKVTVTPIPAQ